MATAKKTTTRRKPSVRKKTTTVTLAARRRTPTKSTPRKRRRAPKKRGLSAAFEPAVMRASFKSAANGGIGGGAGALLMNIVGNRIKPEMKDFALIAGGVVITAAFQAPQTGAGMAGAGPYDIINKWLNTRAGMNDNMYMRDHEYVQGIENLPEMIGPNGEILQDSGLHEDVTYLSQDYLSQDYLSQDYLQDYQTAYAPQFGG